MLNKKKLLIIGPFPPPYGGVSIHIKRLIDLLKTDFEIMKMDESHHKKINVFNLRTINFLKYFHMVIKTNIIHIHSGHYLLRLLHFCTSKIFGKKLIITIHAYEERDKSSIEKYVDRFIFRNTSQVIFVSKEISQKFALKDSFIKNAFLPPNLIEEEQLPGNLSNWIRSKKDQGYYICCANASRLDLCNNEDLYGLDLCIEAAKMCREDNIKLAFVFVVSDISGILNVNYYENLIQQYDLANLFFLHKSTLSFIRLVERADIILRPTNTDGDAITVREGLFLEKKVIASDVTKRPAGTYVFKNRDVISLMCVIRKVNKELKNNGIIESTLDLQPVNVANYKDFYLSNVYNSEEPGT